jgi:hypothetical protein
MSWRDWLRRSKDQPRPADADVKVPAATSREQWTVPDVFFDTEGWQLQSATDVAMAWSAPDARLTLSSVEGSDGTAPLTLTEWRTRHRAMSRSQGQDIVEVERVPLGIGHGLSVITKRRDGLAADYRGTVEIRQGDRRFVISSDFDEGSFTGTRDATVSSAVVMTCGLNLGDPKPDGSRTIRGFFQDAYDPAFDEGALNSYTDDRRVDELLVNHPLSRLRRWHARLEASIALADGTAPTLLILDETPPAVEGPRLLLRAETMWFLYESANRVDLLKKALADEIVALGPAPSERAALCWLYTGCLENKAGRHLSALPALNKADALYRDVNGPECQQLIEVHAHLGWALRELGRDQEALLRLREAIRLLERYPHEQLELLAKTQAGLVLAKRDNPLEQDETRRYVERAQSLLKKFQEKSKPRP